MAKAGTMREQGVMIERAFCIERSDQDHSSGTLGHLEQICGPLETMTLVNRRVQSYPQDPDTSTGIKSTYASSATRKEPKETEIGTVCS